MATEHDSVDLVGDEVVSRFARAALVAALMGATAWIAVPWIGDAPATFQVLIVFLAGIYLGPVWGAASIAIYLVAGAVGAPVFSGGSAGLGAFAGPTGGYLVSFPIGAFIVGAIVHRGVELRDPTDVSPVTLAGAMVVAAAVIYAIGAPWMGFVLEYSAWETLFAGVLVFIPWELIEIAIALAVVRSGLISIK